MGSYEWENVTRVRVGYHARWAVASATFTLPLFALSLLPWLRKRWAIGIGTVVAIFGYYVLAYIGRLFGLSGDLAPPIAAWLPNGVFVFASIALMSRTARRTAFTR